jgi:hypothetical protein
MAKRRSHRRSYRKYPVHGRSSFIRYRAPSSRHQKYPRPPGLRFTETRPPPRSKGATVLAGAGLSVAYVGVGYGAATIRNRRKAKRAAQQGAAMNPAARSVAARQAARKRRRIRGRFA